MPFTSETARIAGKLGGLKTRQKAESEPGYYARIGRKGGEALATRYGQEHFSRIGSLPRPARRKVK